MSAVLPEKAPSALRLLLIEDSLQDEALLLYHLRRAGFDIDSKRVDTKNELAAALAERPWDLVITDHALPGLDSAATVKLVKRSHPELPCLLVSGEDGDAPIDEAVRAGAGGFVSKDHLACLAPIVATMIKVNANEKLIDQSLHRLKKSVAALQDILAESQPLAASPRRRTL